MIATLRDHTPVSRHVLYAVIGAWYRGDRTFYVKRSEKMQNYPGAWSLFSIQYDPSEMPDSTDLATAQRIMERMSDERLYGAPVQVRAFLTASTCNNNPINKIVNLRLYRMELERQPALHRDYYVDAAWLTRTELETRRGNTVCGSCLRAWFDFMGARRSFTESSLN
jgi:hypothetical protein